MLLSQALGLSDRAVVALVGAGGKTTALQVLARELAAAGRRVIATTTAKMYADQLAALSPPLLDEGAGLLAALAARLATANLATCAALPLAGGKLQGLPPALVGDLARLADYVLVEADGAVGALLKAPAPHEPVIPPAATLVVAVAGLNVLGQPLAAPAVHRPELAATLLDKNEGQAITPADVAALLLDPQGGRRGLPPGARFIALLNQAEAGDNLRGGRLAAETLLAGGADRVILAALATPHPVRQALPPGPRGQLAAVVLAAGRGRRYGSLKQRLAWGNGTLLTSAVHTARAADLREIVVVLGAGSAELAADLAGLPVAIAVNPDFAQGMSTSLAAGLSALSPAAAAAVFLLADQPGLKPATIAALYQAYRESGRGLIAPVYQGQRGNPVLVGRKLFPALAEVRGDRGGRDLFDRCPGEVRLVPVDDPAVLADVDTPADYRRLLAERPD